MMARFLLPLALLSGLAWPLAAENARWTSTIEVETAGPVKVELHGRAAERALVDLELIAPDGSLVASQLHANHGDPPWPVTVTRVSSRADFYRVELDAGAAPPPHQGLRFGLARESAAGVLLEGSADGKTWRELTRDSLFRLGSDASLQNFLLDYPPSTDRYLRLDWPSTAGLPELSRATLVLAETTPEKVAITTACEAGATGAFSCRLDLPAACGTLEIALRAQNSPIGYRLWRADGGGWSSIRGGERRGHGPIRLHLGGGGAHLLRLESPATPVLESAWCEQEKPWLTFDAAVPGTYTLSYGRLHKPELLPQSSTSTASGNPLLLGPEKAQPAPSWPAAAKPGTLLAGDVVRSWPVEVAADAEGRLVRLPLPPELGNKPDLRLAAGNFQLPFVAETTDSPELLLRQLLRPVAAPNGYSRFEVRIAGNLGDPTAASPQGGDLLLFAHGPFERQLRFVRREKGPPGQLDREITVGPSTLWRCASSGVRSCDLRIPLATINTLSIEVDDGDNLPLEKLELELWAPRQVLYFVHPGGPLELRELAGQKAPRYDFEEFAPLLLRQEATPARLGPQPATPPAADAPRYLLIAVIALAALALLAVLGRILKT